MKVAIVGSSGYIAHYIIDEFLHDNAIDQIIKIGRSGDYDLYLDLEDPDRFDEQKMEEVDYVIFTAAVSGPDQCAKEQERCWNINVTGTCHIIEKMISKGCKVLFLSSDAVFGEDAGVPFTEKSETKAVTPYGRMKKAVEDTFQNLPGFKALRLSYVVSRNDRFVSYLYNCVKEHTVAEVFHPFYRNAICIAEVVHVIRWLIHNWKEFSPSYLNVAGGELISRVRMADEWKRIVSDGLLYKIVTPENAFFQNRPRITEMKSLYLQEYHILENKSFSERFQAELEDV